MRIDLYFSILGLVVRIVTTTTQAAENTGDADADKEESDTQSSEQVESNDENVSESGDIIIMPNPFNNTLANTLATGNVAVDGSYTVNVGESQTIIPTGLTAVKGQYKTDDYSWTSSDDGIAKITSDTTKSTVSVEGVSSGTAYITLTHNLYKNKSTKPDATETKTYSVTVNGESQLTASTITADSIEVSVAKDGTAEVEITTDGCTVENVTSSSDDIATAEYADGILTITGVAAGEAAVTVTGTADDGPVWQNRCQ